MSKCIFRFLFTYKAGILLAFILSFAACSPQQEQEVAAELTEVINDITTSANHSNRANRNEISIFKKIDATDAEDLEVYIKMNAGVLQLKGGTESLVYAGFIVSDKDREPKVIYERNRNTAILTIRDKEHKGNYEINDSTRNVWNIKLNERIQTELNVEIGAGTAKIIASDLTISRLTVAAGAGKLDIYLNKDFRRDVRVKIAGGIGVTNVYLPNNQAVMVTANKGLGAINSQGLMQEGSTYTNALYKTSSKVLRVDVSAGIGAINLIVED